MAAAALAYVEKDWDESKEGVSKKARGHKNKRTPRI
jgi:hypothetical protein